MHVLLQDWTTVILYYWAVPQKSLQLIQNAAARVLMRSNSRDHVSCQGPSRRWRTQMQDLQLREFIINFFTGQQGKTKGYETLQLNITPETEGKKTDYKH